MTSIIFIFILALILSLVLTPYVTQVSGKMNWVDQPSARKVHEVAMPRTGGVAIYLAFLLSIVASFFLPTQISESLVVDNKVLAVLAGGSLCFCIGLWDDIKKLSPATKFCGQLVAGLITVLGGIKISMVSFPFLPEGINLEWLSVPITLFWFVLIINAVNLIDGLDGLAAGVSLFVSIILIIFCVTTGRFPIAIAFAALGGATLGFLRYNFNPATIFMGDSGSYFLGYMIAALSIMGSIKGQATVALLIPVIALGVPLMDTIVAPIRRFLLGKKMFSPDRQHFHHKLIAMGFTHRNAVLVLYGATIVFGLVAMAMVHAKDDRAALILLLLGSGIIVGIRKLGYLEYVASDKIYGWFKDMTDEAGFSHERRSFLNLQMQIGRSRDKDELWGNICLALEMLRFDMGELALDSARLKAQGLGLKGEEQPETRNPGSPIGQVDDSSPSPNGTVHVWVRDSFDVQNDMCKDCLFKMELPLIGGDNQHFGTLWLIKDLKNDPITHYTLRRVEHLRRTLVGKLDDLIGKGLREKV